ncbi:MAG: exo-alpha-sialidase [Planctomycetales bacterium]|nr:exo-alpha-sialidase [Planctomycetales bacterium]
MKAPCLLSLLFLALLATGSLSAEPALDFDIELTTINSGYDGKTCWVHPRLGAIPGTQPIVVLTMQKLLLTGSDVFYALHEMRTDDLGRHWSGPQKHDTLGRREGADGLIAVICDFTPQWHAKTGTLLGTGHVAKYEGDHLAKDYSRQTGYSVYDLTEKTWSRWDTVAMPDDSRFYSSGAGCSQRVDLPNGDILLPFYTRAKGEVRYTTSVMRCQFDGAKLRYVEHGPELALEVSRGMVEPSLTQFAGKFYLTIRNDQAGYVATSNDGLHFDPPKKWTFDDGTDLGSYNTQQHWVTHSDGLFLVYTRRGLDNDHVFRHRAPLMIARVDPQTLQVIRRTERVLVPERGARLGNFAITNVNEHETWVSVAEWMQRNGPDYVIPVDNPHGADNSVYVAKILWK